MYKIRYILLALILFSCSAPANKSKEITVPQKPSRTEPVPSYSRFGSAKANSELHTAWRLYRSGKYRQSALAFEDMIAGGYIHYDVAFGAGLAYMKYYDNEKAIKYFSQAVSLNPSHFEALYLMAEIKKQNKDFVSARQFLERILAINYSDKVLCGFMEKDYLSLWDFEKRKKDSLFMLKQM